MQRGFEDKNQGIVTSQIDLESLDDKSKIVLFVKHSKRVELKDSLPKHSVLFVRNAVRKISTKIDIYCQLQFAPKNLMLLGHVPDSLTDFFSASDSIHLIKSIPADHIVRYVIKLCGFILDINFVKIQYKCDKCNQEIQNENVCRNGCIIKDPHLYMQVLCQVQDGTAKASLELKNERVVKAFGISDEMKQSFKEYCLKNGTFVFPQSSNHNYHYKDIVAVFKRNEVWSQLLFYCKPFCKMGKEEKNRYNQKKTCGQMRHILSTLAKQHSW